MWGVFSSGKVRVAVSLAPPTLLQVFHPVASALNTTIIAWKGVWECCGESRMDVRQRSRGVGGVL